jgi:hypothetical protein
MEWLGNCWHQSSTSFSGVPEMVLLLTVNRSIRPDATQPSDVLPGGSGHPSFSHRGAAADSPRMWLYVYET